MAFTAEPFSVVIKLIDSQVYTAHLESLGARMIPRNKYIETLRQTTDITMPANWNELFQQFLLSGGKQ